VEKAVITEAPLQIRGIMGDAGQNRLILRGTLDAYLAGDLHRCAIDLFESGRDVTLDLSEVDSMDVSIMQILLALRGDLVSAGRTLAVSAAGANAARSLRMGGMADIFAVA
jgi:anti-anti-sigma factor